MWRFKAILIGFFGILFFGGLARVYAAPVESNTKMRSVSGEIAWVDVKHGLLQLKSDAGQDTRGCSANEVSAEAPPSAGIAEVLCLPYNYLCNRALVPILIDSWTARGIINLDKT